MIKFHKEGYKIIFFSLLFFILSNYLIQSPDWLSSLYLLISSIFIILILQFFRNPNRKVTASENEIVAPADGKVVVIEEVEETEYFKDKRIQVSIFMSPINVHVNRYPISGIVKYAKYHPGKYLVAWHPKSSIENERTSIVVENKKFSILFRQIAGALARRIVMYSKTNEEVVKGDDFGFIKFGSRVDIFLPVGTDIKVKLNQKVKGNQSIIAKY
ncbi:MAG: phosphatidylserine decarboxylase family protein [Flavobacteriales bacterium]